MRIGVPLSTLVLAIALAGCSSKPAADDPAAAMQAGLDALYTQRDPEAAVIEFRKVLSANPTHYGATYQLAAALDAAGRQDEARPLWERMLALAESSGDQRTAATVRARLGQPPVETEETIMRAGLDALYQRREPTAAVAEFQKVLANNPAHYGATFQLAAALDAAGRPKEARPYWEKVLAMAQGYADAETANRARTRLAHEPDASAAPATTGRSSEIQAPGSRRSP
jgi:tetratricopeptide (TPR) repeat protein